MVMNYDVAKIENALRDFYNATGIDIDLMKPDFSPTGSYCWENNRYCQYVQTRPEGHDACVCSDIRMMEKCRDDKKTTVSVCHAGLVNVCIPILNNDVIFGYIIAGRMKQNTDFSALTDCVAGLKLDAERSREYYDEIPLFDAEKIKSISNIATMFVKYILFEDMLKPGFNDTVEKVIAYIDGNLKNDLSIETILKDIHVSKSALYEKFHSCFRCTVGEYIKRQRINRSIELLKKNDLSIEEISQRVGFSSASYYSKMFKKQFGVAPIKYKKFHMRGSGSE